MSITLKFGNVYSGTTMTIQWVSQSLADWTCIVHVVLENFASCFIWRFWEVIKVCHGAAVRKKAIQDWLLLHNTPVGVLKMMQNSDLRRYQTWVRIKASGSRAVNYFFALFIKVRVTPLSERILSGCIFLNWTASPTIIVITIIVIIIILLSHCHALISIYHCYFLLYSPYFISSQLIFIVWRIYILKPSCISVYAFR